MYCFNQTRDAAVLGLSITLTSADYVMMKERDTEDPKAAKEEDVILLKDLTPKKDVKGGSRKVLFGEEKIAKKDEEK